MEVTYDDLLDFNKKLLSYTGEPFGVVNRANLESALGVQTYPYECEEQVAASLLRSLVTAHGFINGNKRTAVVAMARVKEIPTSCTDEQLIDLVYKIASEGGSKISVNYISNYIYGTTFEESLNEAHNKEQFLSEDEMKQIICGMIDKYDASEEETFDELQSHDSTITRDLVHRLYGMCNKNKVIEEKIQSSFDDMWEELDNMED